MPPKSPKRPSRGAAELTSGPLGTVVIGGADGVDEGAHLACVLPSRSGLELARGIDTERTDIAYERRDVAGVEPAGDEEPASDLDAAARPLPVGALPRSARKVLIVRVEHVRAERHHREGHRIRELGRGEHVPDLGAPRRVRRDIVPAPDLDREERE